MVASIHHAEIVRSIVGTPTINVMNDLFPPQRSAQDFLCDLSVLKISATEGWRRSDILRVISCLAIWIYRPPFCVRLGFGPCSASSYSTVYVGLASARVAGDVRVAVWRMSELLWVAISCGLAAAFGLHLGAAAELGGA